MIKVNFALPCPPLKFIIIIIITLTDHVVVVPRRCSSDDVYDYSGEECEEATMRVKWVAGIAGGVCGAVILVFLVVVVCCLCFCRRSGWSKKEAPLDDS